MELSIWQDLQCPRDNTIDTASLVHHFSVEPTTPSCSVTLVQTKPLQQKTRSFLIGKTTL